MLFSQHSFSTFSGQKVSHTAEGCEVLFSIDAASGEEVDALANRVATAGGNIFSKPADVQGWMYGLGFCDPDGHRWNVLFMDFDRMPR